MLFISVLELCSSHNMDFSHKQIVSIEDMVFGPGLLSTLSTLRLYHQGQPSEGHANSWRALALEEVSHNKNYICDFRFEPIRNHMTLGQQTD